jgi:hypothetical protein
MAARSVDNLSGREMAEFHEAFSLFDKDGTLIFFRKSFFFRLVVSDVVFVFFFVGLGCSERV